MKSTSTSIDATRAPTSPPMPTRPGIPAWVIVLCIITLVLSAYTYIERDTIRTDCQAACQERLDVLCPDNYPLINTGQPLPLPQDFPNIIIEAGP